MKAVIQRVKQSRVKVGHEITGEIKKGILVFLGVEKGDTEKDADYLAGKIINLRIFEDDNGKMNLPLTDVGGELLAVSQFTLLGDCRKGRRPSFVKAAPPEDANRLYEYFVEKVKSLGVCVRTGKFQAMMEVSLINDGPVTFILESVT